MSAGGAACGTPIPWEELVAYWSGDLDERDVDRLDEHLMGCATCSAESRRVSALTEALRAMVPPMIDHAKLAVLEARGHQIRSNVLLPDERRTVVFEADTDFLIHRLRLDLSGAVRVGVRVLAETTGDVLLAEPSAPFDRESGELLVACQRHFASFPWNVVFEVEAHDVAGGVTLARYAVPHVFVPRAGA